MGLFSFFLQFCSKYLLHWKLLGYFCLLLCALMLIWDCCSRATGGAFNLLACGCQIKLRFQVWFCTGNEMGTWHDRAPFYFFTIQSKLTFNIMDSTIFLNNFFFARCEIILTFCHKVHIFNPSDHYTPYTSRGTMIHSSWLWKQINLTLPELGKHCAVLKLG